MENTKYEHWNNPQPAQDNKKLAALLAILLALLGFINSFWDILKRE
jgi:hypothetical protein